MKEASGIAVLDGLDDQTLRRAIRAGSMTVRVGPDDLLRTLVVRLRFGVDATSPLADVLERVAGAELVFTVDIAEPNQPIHIEVPQDARPVSELPGT